MSRDYMGKAEFIDEARSALTAAKHTPGPWFVGAQNDGLYVLDAAPSPAPYDGPIPREYGPNVVATPNFRIAGYEANARLIAAAPDLLAALKRIELDWDGEPDDMDEAREAITKATGGGDGR